MNRRPIAESWFQQTLRHLSPRRLVAQAVISSRPPRALHAYGRIVVLALGKAAEPMLAGWFDALLQLGSSPRTQWRAVVSAPAGGAIAPALTPGTERDAQPSRGAPRQSTIPVSGFASGHPDPNPESLKAAEAMLDAARWVRQAPTTSPGLLLALISGGGSALAELPVDADLDAWCRLNRALVTSGAPINAINLVRRHVSAFKGGRVAAAAAGADQWTLVLSDVAGGDLSAIASGPTCPDATTLEQARAALWKWAPDALARRYDPLLVETPKSSDAAFAAARFQLLADNHDACATLATLARAAGRSPVLVDHSVDEATSAEAADHLVRRWRALRCSHPTPALVAGGEVRVQVPPHAHGRGGRNTDLALRVAAAMAGEVFCFLSAGTDGIDGTGPFAGACVDGSTLARAAGLDPAHALRRFDSATLLQASGDLLLTGPTGNNLRDLRLFL